MGYGGKYSVNKHFEEETGRYVKNEAHRQMRCEAKDAVQHQVVSEALEEVWEERSPNCGFPDDDPCNRCGEDGLFGDCRCYYENEVKVWEFPVDNTSPSV